jgi:serine/threonine-protein kinase RsbT
MDEQHVLIRTGRDIGAARLAVKNAAETLGFGILDQARIATAAAELTRNVVQYAGSGAPIVRPVDGRRRVGLELVCTDRGPGIPDVAQILRGAARRRTKMGWACWGCDC